METTNANQYKETARKTVVSGELALLIAVIINSLGVVLMLYSKAGISAVTRVK